MSTDQVLHEHLLAQLLGGHAHMPFDEAVADFPYADLRVVDRLSCNACAQRKCRRFFVAHACPHRSRHPHHVTQHVCLRNRLDDELHQLGYTFSSLCLFCKKGSKLVGKIIQCQFYFDLLFYQSPVQCR